MIRRNEWLGIILGFLLLMGCHLLAGALVFGLSFPISALINEPYAILMVWAWATTTLFLWQLIYVLPLVFWLRRRRKIAMMKGVILGAILTGLIAATCFVYFWIPR